MQPPPSDQSGPLQDASIIHLQPLHDRQIRVLALQPGSSDDSLACQLHVVDVDAKDKNVSFEAISYVWGTRGTTESIMCRAGNDGDQVSLPITRNAADALKAFRQPQDERLLWIDSVCISQSSQLEKSAQVGMMDSIFTNATAVLIWLGCENTVRSPAAGESFKRWDDWSQGATPKEKKEMLHRLRPDDSSMAFQWCREHLFSSSEIQMVLDIFECGWFWRLWCVQELVLAKKALVCWGSVRLAWETISEVAIHVQALHPSTVAQSGLAGIHNVLMLEHLRDQIKGEAKRSLAFSRLLSLTRVHGVTEHHDRIFSLLGLDRCLRSSQLVEKELEEQFITPDYSQNIEEVYLATARKLLVREGNLHLLSLVQHGDKIATKSLPSWVPQWHINTHRLITQFDLVSGHPVNVALESVWARRTDSTAEHLQSSLLSGKSFHVSSDDILQAEGLLLDDVSKRCEDPTFTPDSGSGWIETFRQWFREVVTWLKQGFEQNPGISSGQLNDIAFRIFYRTLFGGHLSIKEVFKTLREELPVLRSALFSANTEDVESCPTTKRLVVQMCRSRALFLTAKGKIGIGPQCLGPGDSVCLLSGAAVPLLMRPCPRDPLRWLLVGETYVNGLAYASNDYEIAEDFEAVHISGVPENLLNFTAGSNSRVRKDLESELDRRTRGWPSFSNLYVRLDHMSGKLKRQIVLPVIRLTGALQKKRFCRISWSRRHLLTDLMSRKSEILTLANPESFLSNERLEFRMLSGIDKGMTKPRDMRGIGSLSDCDSSRSRFSKSVRSGIVGETMVRGLR
jgi:hypothetical protein